MKQRLTIISNIAPRYRSEIYRLLENTFDCNWLFGQNHTDIPECDATFMRSRHTLPTGHGPKNSYWLKGAVARALGKGTPGNILMLGEVKFLTSWWILLLNRLRCKNRRKNIALWTHGWRGNEKGLQRLLTRFYLRLPNKVLFYGERARELAIAQGLPASRALAVHNSLNHDLFLQLRQSLESEQPSKETLLSKFFANPALPLFVFIGRLTPTKKLHQLIEALSILDSEGIANNILFIGDGEEATRLKEMGAGMNRRSNIAFMGSCYDETVSAPYIYLADACVSPGNIGLTVIHAMELGTPAITHNDMTRQVPEAEIIKEGLNGWLFPPDDVDALARAMARAIEKNNDSRQAIREACHEAVEDWTPRYQLKVIASAFG